MAASILPAEWGCARAGQTSTFETNDAGSDAAPAYDLPPLWSGSAPVRIETGEQALSLALDDAGIYWQNPGGSVFACPLAGCPSSKPTLLSSLIGSQSGVLETLGASDGVAVFLTSYGVAISAFAGTDPAHSPTSYRETPGGRFGSVVTDATQAYFVDDVSVDAGAGIGNLAPTLYACALGASCSSPDRLYGGSSESTLGPLFVADSELYFVELTSTGTIRAVSIQGGKAREVCSSSLLYGVQALTVAGGYAYFTTVSERASVYRCMAHGGSDASVYVRDLQPYALASDGTNLYWTNYTQSPGSVVTCALGATCAVPLTVAYDQEDPFAIAADAKSVYWSTASEIYRADR